jgi:hypothetical protein
MPSIITITYLVVLHVMLRLDCVIEVFRWGILRIEFYLFVIYTRLTYSAFVRLGIASKPCSPDGNDVLDWIILIPWNNPIGPQWVGACPSSFTCKKKHFQFPNVVVYGITDDGAVQKPSDPKLKLFQTKRNLLYIRHQSVPRCKHFPPRL